MESSVNYISLIENLIRPLIHYQEDLCIKELPSETEYILLQVIVNKQDLGRVIGKQGKVANAIRTLAYAMGSQHHKKIKINFDSYE
ncbi:MAG: KH domain-containing protein [Turicibacter sp.]|nr:KH domain-containing protein [Turicibacter sp.]